MSVARDLRALLRFPDFRKLLTVRLLSQLADGVYQVALAAYVVFSPEKETSPAAIASALAVLLLPYSLLGPFAGVLLDRWRRRQVLFFGNVLRTVLASVTAAFVLGAVPDWLVFLSALTVTAVNRFVLAGLSAALPRVVDGERLVLANSISPTAGTLAATLGGGVAFVVRFLAPGTGRSSDALVLLTGAGIYLLSGLAALRLGRNQLGPDPSEVQPRVLAAVASTARGLLAGMRHLGARPTAAYALGAVTLMRFCYGALTVTVLMLCRYAWNGADSAEGGLGLLGLALGLSGLGFFAAAVLTPAAAGRLGVFRWMALCAGAAAVLEPALGLPFAPVPTLTAAFVLGLVTQASKIATDTAVQTSVDDAYRGRVFSLYDMLYNVAYVGAAGVAALMLPPDGRSAAVVLGVAVLYAVIALAVLRVSRETTALGGGGEQSEPVSPPAGPPTTS
ncbi:MFS transporter [Streptomyces albus]|uniref:MFS transporter n=1 Tax=Streptomyces albus TaxID=1888 RepID=UPI0033F9CDE4